MYIFNAAIRADLAWLVILGVLNAAISAYYYLGVVRQMFLSEPEDEEPIRTTPPIGISIAVATVGIFVFGVIPMPLITAAKDAVQIFAH
jgi:NADH-quinone oxidoreductase subunit N